MMRRANFFGFPVCRLSGLAALVVSVAAVGWSQPAMATEEVTGAGSSFAAPLYEAWSAASSAKTGVRVNYQTIGSGAGQNQVLAGTVDFGASDAPMAPERLTSGKLMQFPTAIGGVVIIVNVPGVPEGTLRLNGPILAGLYDGSITSWNDERIAALNPGVTLPDLAVAPLHRADGSGTTYVFTDYLSRVAPKWLKRVGKGTSVAWPMGAGARGNDGIASYVRNTEGSLGYVEYAYAERNHLATVQLQNRAGDFVAPTAESFTKAADAATWDDNTLTASLCDTNGQGAWPIVTTTYALIPRDSLNKSRGKAVSRFFGWGLTDGEAESRKLDYVPVPVRIRNVVLHRLNG